MIRRDFSERDIHMALDGELPAEERAGLRHLARRQSRDEGEGARFTADRGALREPSPACSDEPVPARLRKAVLGEAPPGRCLRARAGGLPLLRRCCLPSVDLAAISPALTGVGQEDRGGRSAGRAGDRRSCHLRRRAAACGGSAGQRQGSSADLAVQSGRLEAGGAGPDRERFSTGWRPAACRPARARPRCCSTRTTRASASRSSSPPNRRRTPREPMSSADRRPAGRLLAGQGLWLRRRRLAAATSSWATWPRTPTGQLLAGMAS